MTVSSSTSRVKYSCNGSVTEFAFTFGVGATSEIQVIYTDTTGTETVLTETTHYAVSATNNDFESGGKVTTVSTYATGTYITILRNVPLTQASDFTENRATLYETFEDGLDKNIRIDQQQQEEINRIPKLAKSSAYAGNTYTFPDPSASKVIGWNSGATDLTTYLINGTALNISNIVNIGDYSNNIATAISSIGSAETTLCINASTAGNATIPTNVQLWFIKGGNLTGTVAFAGSPDSQIKALPGQQIFSSTSTITFGVRGREIYPEWLGVKVDDLTAATTNSVAMQKCIDLGIPIMLPNGTIYFDTSLKMAYTTVIIGKDRATSILDYTGTGSALISTGTGVRSFRHNLKSFWLTTNNASNAGWGINFQELLTYGIIDDVEITNFGVGGIWLKKGWVNEIRKCMIRDCGTKDDGAVYGIKIGGEPGQTTTTTINKTYVSGITNTAVTGVGIYWEDAYKVVDSSNVTESCDIGRTVTWTGVGSTTTIHVEYPYYEANSTNLVWNDSYGTYIGEIDPNPIATWSAVSYGYRHIAFISNTQHDGSVSNQFGSTSIYGRTTLSGALTYEAGTLLDNNNVVFDPVSYHIFRAAPASGKTITLPTAVGIGGAVMRVVKVVDTGTTTVLPNGSETISGAASYVLNNIGEHITIISDNANWWIIEAGGIKQAAIADTSSGVAATIEAEVNKVKAALREFGIIAP
jgi:hypothetical protein